MRIFKFTILILVVICNLVRCDNDSSDSNSPKCCANTTDQRVVVEFSSNVVQHEYIVQFKDYYQALARAKFLKSAIDNAGVTLTDYLLSIVFTCNEFIDKELDNRREIEPGE